MTLTTDVYVRCPCGAVCDYEGGSLARLIAWCDDHREHKPSGNYQTRARILSTHEPIASDLWGKAESNDVGFRLQLPEIRLLLGLADDPEFGKMLRDADDPEAGVDADEFLRDHPDLA